ncbi:hypothetical protein COCOBI_03-7060 [Coccomyxa sp. Obi]|nr:hypothetical protein COCOBI_03-7060 [Coccomyxa sp. Obi]
MLGGPFIHGRCPPAFGARPRAERSKLFRLGDLLRPSTVDAPIMLPAPSPTHRGCAPPPAFVSYLPLLLTSWQSGDLLRPSTADAPIIVGTITNPSGLCTTTSIRLIFSCASDFMAVR